MSHKRHSPRIYIDPWRRRYCGHQAMVEWHRVRGSWYMPAWAEWWNGMLTELVSTFSLQQSYSGGVRRRPLECSCRSIMLRQDELGFMKAISTLQVSQAFLKELSLAMARRKKKPAVPAGRRSTTSGRGTQSFPTTRGQEKSQRASTLGRLDGARQQAPSTWRWVLATARDLNSHGRTSCCRQLAKRTIRGSGNVRDCIGWAHRPVSPNWAAQVHSRGFGPIRTRCLNGDNQ